MDDAQWDLNELANDLYKLEVKTTGELLQDSKLLESHYKFKFIDGKPTLKQEKYITVPLTNGYEETLLQEHIIGSKDYELSVQEPLKEKTFRLAKASI